METTNEMVIRLAMAYSKVDRTFSYPPGSPNRYSTTPITQCGNHLKTCCLTADNSRQISVTN
jgi:hypothetical protein